MLALMTRIILSLPYRTKTLYFTNTFFKSLILSRNKRDIKALVIKIPPIEDSFLKSILKDFVNKYRVKAP